MNALQGQHQPGIVPKVERVRNVTDVAKGSPREPRRWRSFDTRSTRPEQQRTRRAGPPRQDSGKSAVGVQTPHGRTEGEDSEYRDHGVCPFTPSGPRSEEHTSELQS